MGAHKAVHQTRVHAILDATRYRKPRPDRVRALADKAATNAQMHRDFVTATPPELVLAIERVLARKIDAATTLEELEAVVERAVAWAEYLFEPISDDFADFDRRLASAKR